MRGYFLKVALVALTVQSALSTVFEQPEVEIESFETEEQETTEQDLEQVFEINQRGAIYDSVTGKRRYDNYKLVRVNPQTDDHLDVLQFLDKGKN